MEYTNTPSQGRGQDEERFQNQKNALRMSVGAPRSPNQVLKNQRDCNPERFLGVCSPPGSYAGRLVAFPYPSHLFVEESCPSGIGVRVSHRLHWPQAPPVLPFLPVYFCEVNKRAMLSSSLVCADSLFAQSDVSRLLADTQTSSSLCSQQALVDVASRGSRARRRRFSHRSPARSSPARRCRRESGSLSRQSKLVRFDSPAPSSALKGLRSNFNKHSQNDFYIAQIPHTRSNYHQKKNFDH